LEPRPVSRRRFGNRDTGRHRSAPSVVAELIMTKRTALAAATALLRSL
jgi:hypothetical protein